MLIGEKFWPRLVRAARSEVRLFRPRQHLAQAIAGALPHLTFNFTRTAVLRAAGVRLGRRSLFLGPLIVSGEGSWSEMFSVGSDTLITGPLYVDLAAPVTIGDRVRIGHQVLLLTVDHAIGTSEQRCSHEQVGPISIGDGAWIGSRATILPGISIGPGSVVAAGAVVTRNVPPNTLVAGIPARVLRELDESGLPSSRRLVDVSSARAALR